MGSLETANVGDLTVLEHEQFIYATVQIGRFGKCLKIRTIQKQMNGNDS